MSEPRVLMPCPVCHVLPIPKEHAHYADDLSNWYPVQPPFSKKTLDVAPQP